ncbi:MAG: hypothetical protein JST28_02450 [Acidobacteria bacterium]|nr:hypothetical protein [Acidobacteriota bacterium]
MKIALGCLTSIVLGFLLMIPLSMLFDAMNWPLFHTWGLAHGSFILAWPMLTILSFGILWAAWLAKRNPR